MGLVIAREAAARGAHVQVLLGPVESAVASAFQSFDCYRYETPEQYGLHLEKLFGQNDIFFSAAAVLDFEFVTHPKKIAREDLGESLNTPIRAVSDFAAWAGRHKRPDQILIAFAAEVGTPDEICARAEKKRAQKNADAILANPIEPGLGPEADNNEFWILRAGTEAVHLGPAAKDVLAAKLFDVLFGSP